jgi:WD40 repeat protein
VQGLLQIVFVIRRQTWFYSTVIPNGRLDFAMIETTGLKALLGTHKRTKFEPLARSSFRFSLRTLLVASLFIGSVATLGWNWNSWVLRQSIAAHANTVNSVSFSADGSMLLTCSNDTTARLWNVADGRRVAILAGHTKAVDHAVFTSDGKRVATVSRAEGCLRTWDAMTGAPLATILQLAPLSAPVISPDGKTAAISEKTRVSVWQVESGAFVCSLGVYSGTINSVQFSNDGRQIVTAGGDGSVCVWDSSTGVEVAALDAHKGGAWQAAFSEGDNHVYSVGADGNARVWDIPTKHLHIVMRWKDKLVHSAAISPNAKRILTNIDGHSLRVWDVEREMRSVLLRQEIDAVSEARFSADGNYVLRNELEKLQVWDAASGAEIASISTGPLSAPGAISPDGQRIATVNASGEVMVWMSNGRHTSAGVIGLPEFWLTIVFSGLLIASVIRDMQDSRIRRAAEAPSPFA